MCELKIAQLKGANTLFVTICDILFLKLFLLVNFSRTCEAYTCKHMQEK